MAHDVADISAKQGAEVTLTSVFDVDKMQANKHEIEQAQAEGIAILGGMAPVGVVKDANGRATALRVRSAKPSLFLAASLKSRTSKVANMTSKPT